MGRAIRYGILVAVLMLLSGCTAILGGFEQGSTVEDAGGDTGPLPVVEAGAPDGEAFEAGAPEGGVAHDASIDGAVADAGDAAEQDGSTPDAAADAAAFDASDAAEVDASDAAEGGASDAAALDASDAGQADANDAGLFDAGGDAAATDASDAGHADGGAQTDGGTDASPVQDGGGADAPSASDSSVPDAATDAGQDAAFDAVADAPVDAADAAVNYTVTINVSGLGAGSVSVSPGGVTCDAGTCQTSLPSGTNVTISTTPGNGSQVGSWTGVAGCSGAAACLFPLTGPVSVAVSFGLVSETLQVTVNGTGSVSSPNPTAISCTSAGGASCTASAPYGTQVTFTASPGTGQTTSWSGAATCSAGATTCPVTLSGATNVTVTFTPVPETLTAGVTGSGTVSSNPGSISCTSAGGTSCQGTFPYGTPVTLTAYPSTGWEWSSWSASACTTSQCTVSVTGTMSVSAIFILIPEPVTVTVTGGGSVSGGTIACVSGGSACSGTIAYGTNLLLTETTPGGYTFGGWGGACSGSGTTCTVPDITGPISVSANFIPNETIVVGTNGTGRGSVTGTPGGLSCSMDAGECQATVAAGTSVNLTASSGTGSVFTGWSGTACSGFDASCAVSVDASVSAVATFNSLLIPTWDPLWSPPGVVFSNGDLSVATTSSAHTNARTNIGVSSGTWYWEITATGGDGTSDQGGLGIAGPAYPNTGSYLGYTALDAGALSFGYGSCCSAEWWNDFPSSVTLGQAPTAGTAVKAGDVYSFALDMNAGNLWIGMNGSWFSDAGVPGVAGKGVAPSVSGLTGTIYPAVTLYGNSVDAFTANFGASPFQFTVPAGFTPGFGIATWDTSFSPASAVTYSNSNLSVSGAGAPEVANLRTNIAVDAGAWYWEIDTNAGSASQNMGGVGLATTTTVSSAGALGYATPGAAFAYGAAWQDGWYNDLVASQAALPTSGLAVAKGNIYMFALDLGTGNLWVGLNGTWLTGTPTPASGTAGGPALWGLSQVLYPALSLLYQGYACTSGCTSDAFTANFGWNPAVPFTYPVPTGFAPGYGMLGNAY